MLSLSITGFDADPQSVTDILGIQPTSSIRKGEVTRSGRTSEFNGWWLEARPDRLVSGGDHAEAVAVLIEAVRGRAAAFNALRETVSPKSVTIYGGFYHQGDSQCGIWLDAGDMRILGECGIAWGLDLFCNDLRTSATGRKLTVA